MGEKIDLFIFGSRSELIQDLITKHQGWFKENVHQLYVSQRGEGYPDIYKAFNPISLPLDCADPQAFRARLADIVAKHKPGSRTTHVFPTYGKFSWNYADKSPVFSFTDDGYQVNLNARLQIIDAFRKLSSPVKFHLFGSLFANFPYAGDYAASMWCINQLPRNPEYANLDLSVYNIGGCKTGFWDHTRGPKNNPFVHDQLPTDALFDAAFVNPRRGVFHFYPSFASRIACFLGRMGVRVL